MSTKQAAFTFKILLLGDAAVGKTALVNRFVSSKFIKDYVLTIGMEPYSKYAKIGKTQICYSLWDIAGAQQFSRMRNLFYRGARGSMVSFDLTRKDTFDNVDNWIEDANKASPNQVFILVGNKNDLKKERKVERRDAEAKAKKLNCISYIETSALTGQMVEEAFTEIGKSLLLAEQKKRR
ncbi:MAG: GTP-binding protein [Candidatus Kariarchaeaceae archaeon]|jgi:small GTP-binding protein